jgi:hypothetical protein
MKGIPEEILYLLLFGAVLLFNYITQQIARRRQAEAEQQQPPPEEQQTNEAPGDFWGRSPETQAALLAPAEPVAPVRRYQPPVARPTRRPGRFSKQALFGNKRDVQNAVVIATILGPCRAMEPPGTATDGAASGAPLRRAAR